VLHTSSNLVGPALRGRGEGRGDFEGHGGGVFGRRGWFWLQVWAGRRLSIGVTQRLRISNTGLDNGGDRFG